MCCRRFAGIPKYSGRVVDSELEPGRLHYGFCVEVEGGCQKQVRGVFARAVGVVKVTEIAPPTGGFREVAGLWVGGRFDVVQCVTVVGIV